MLRWFRRKRTPDPYVTALTAGYRGEVLLARSLLEGAGIPHVVNSDAVQDLFGWGRIGTGFNFITGPARVLVAREDADLAKELLSDLQSSTPPRIPLCLRAIAAIVLVMDATTLVLVCRGWV